MTEPTLIYLVDKPAGLSDAQIDDLIAALDPAFVRLWPICGRCARPIILLSVPHEPIAVYDSRSAPRCRSCERRHKRAYDERRRAKQEAAE